MAMNFDNWTDNAKAHVLKVVGYSPKDFLKEREAVASSTTVQ
jgi:hypothetical protein